MYAPFAADAGAPAGEGEPRRTLIMAYHDGTYTRT